MEEISEIASGKLSFGSEFAGLLNDVLRQKSAFIHGIFDNAQVGRQIAMMLLAVLVLSGAYGLAMGAPGGWRQMFSSGLKVPALLLLTLAICFPVLFVVNVLMGSKLGILQTLALIMFALTLNSIMLASFAPVAAFFGFSGSDYHFMKLLHVVVFAFCGAWGMIALWHGMAEVCDKTSLYPPQGMRILRIWILVFGFVGTQMAWTLRPYIGAPELPFEMFRKNNLGKNFYTATWYSVSKLFHGESATISAPMPAVKAEAK